MISVFNIFNNNIILIIHKLDNTSSIYVDVNKPSEGAIYLNIEH